MSLCRYLDGPSKICFEEPTHSLVARMNSLRFVFDATFDFFLPPRLRGGPFDYPFEGQPSIKHLVEALGVPHTEAGAVQIDGQPAPIDSRALAGSLVQVFPPEAGPVPAAGDRFLLDNHLGRLAAYLRMLGFDSLYRNDYQDDELARVAEQETRILLTRDRRLLMRRGVRYGYCPRSLQSREQLREVVARFDLLARARPFYRCLRCNTPLTTIEKEAVTHLLQPLTRQYFDTFRRCPTCGYLFWKGSHFERMQAMIASLI